MALDVIGSGGGRGEDDDDDDDDGGSVFGSLRINLY